MKRNKNTRRIFVLCVVAVFIIFAAVAALKWDAIFQRGNPLPYLAAMVKLTGENSFEAVNGMDGIFITRRDDKAGLFQMIQDTYYVEFKEQFGNAYLFTDGEQNYTIGSEIYWGSYTVWTLPFDGAFSG